jgi:preprotein translocase subunit SecG
METALYILHILVSIGMLPVILLQSGKGGGVSAVFGGGGAGTVFGSRGASNFLTKMTTACAVIFMCTSMGLSWYSSRTRSVVGDVGTPPPKTGEPTTMVPGADDQSAKPGEASTSTQ